MSNSLSVHLLPLSIPVTGRPCGLFSVTSGPETYMTGTSLTTKAAVSLQSTFSNHVIRQRHYNSQTWVISHTLKWTSCPSHILSLLTPQGLAFTVSSVPDFHMSVSFVSPWLKCHHQRDLFCNLRSARAPMVPHCHKAFIIALITS